MCLTICSGRPVAGSLKAVQLKRQHLSHMITFLRQFPTRHARQMALFQLVSNDCTSGTKGSTPCTGIIAVFLLQFVFCAFTWQMAAVVSSIRLALARCADRDLNGDGQSKALRPQMPVRAWLPCRRCSVTGMMRLYSTARKPAQSHLWRHPATGAKSVRYHERGRIYRHEHQRQGFAGT